MFIKVYPRLFRELKPVSIAVRLSYFKILNAKNINKDPRASLKHVKSLIEKGFIEKETPVLLPKKTDGFIQVPFELFAEGKALNFMIVELTKQGFSMAQIAVELSVNRHTVSSNYFLENHVQESNETSTTSERKLNKNCIKPAQFSHIRIYRERKEKKREEKKQSIYNNLLTTHVGVMQNEIAELKKIIEAQNERMTEFFDKLILSGFKRSEHAFDTNTREDVLSLKFDPKQRETDAVSCQNFGKVSSLCENTKNEMKKVMQGLTQNQKTIILGTLAEVMTVSDVKSPIGYVKKLSDDARKNSLESNVYEKWVKRLSDEKVLAEKNAESEKQLAYFKQKEDNERAEQKRIFDEAVKNSGKTIDDFLKEVKGTVASVYSPVVKIEKERKTFSGSDRKNFLAKMIDTSNKF